jgi:hypothetical protein
MLWKGVFMEKDVGYTVEIAVGFSDTELDMLIASAYRKRLIFSISN